MDNKGLDFGGLPVGEVSAVLRRLVGRILDELFDEDCGPGQPLKKARPLKIGELLTRKEFLLLDSSCVWEVHKKRPAYRIASAFRDELPRALKKLMKRTVNRKKKVTAEQWNTAVCNRVALALGGTAGDGLPDGLWPVVAKAAWYDPYFTHTINMKIIRWLKQMRLFYPFQVPAAHFSLPTFWILIAISDPKPLKFHTMFSHTERAAVRVCRRLFREAHMEAMTNGWAGFWDQWLIRLAMQRWPSGFKHLDTRLCKALMALPLMGNRDWTKQCTAKGKVKLYNRTFGERVHDLIDRIKRRRRPPRDFHRTALLNLTAQGWENHMPEMFSALRPVDGETTFS